MFSVQINLQHFWRRQVPVTACGACWTAIFAGNLEVRDFCLGIIILCISPTALSATSPFREKRLGGSLNTRAGSVQFIWGSQFNHLGHLSHLNHSPPLLSTFQVAVIIILSRPELNDSVTQWLFTICTAVAAWSSDLVQWILNTAPSSPDAADSRVYASEPQASQAIKLWTITLHINQHLGGFWSS